ncbi:MAG TPA: hypothetical protein DDY68_02465, partial [Porphyromonadaceae bacterium]|nr:hypothetical protein [Porphyromonadaceae bacterium]
SFMAAKIPININLLDNAKFAAITAVQPVFMGGRIVNSNKLAHLNEKVSQWKTILSKNDVQLSTEKCYWQIVELKEKMRTLDAISAQLDELYKTVKNMVEVGVAMPNDLLKVELHKQDLESSRLKAENGLMVTKLLLRQKTGIEERDFDVACDSFPAIVQPMEYYVEPSVGVEQRAESKLLDANVKASKLQHKITLGKNLPSIGVGASYLSYDILEKNNSGILMAGVSIPISDWWGGSYALKREMLKVREAENTQKDSKELMVVEIESKWSNLSEAYSQILLAKKSIASAKENLRLNQNCYEAGTIPLTELLDAETMLQKSEDQYTESRANYLILLTEYLQSVGK